MFSRELYKQQIIQFSKTWDKYFNDIYNVLKELNAFDDTELKIQIHDFIYCICYFDLRRMFVDINSFDAFNPGMCVRTVVHERLTNLDHKRNLEEYGAYMDAKFCLMSLGYLQPKTLKLHFLNKYEVATLVESFIEGKKEIARLGMSANQFNCYIVKAQIYFFLSLLIFKELNNVVDRVFKEKSYANSNLFERDLYITKIIAEEANYPEVPKKCENIDFTRVAKTLYPIIQRLAIRTHLELVDIMHEEDSISSLSDSDYEQMENFLMTVDRLPGNV